MAKASKDKQNVQPTNDDAFDQEEYNEMELLERLETLREDMEDLGITTLAEVIERIETLHKKLDALVTRRPGRPGEQDRW
ncbi:MAG TPA: hypothetical protein VKR83_03340 [Ktedonobacteraceae bacterium]|nr:hypothetical protein [Ktedonobacteraceae bacterium]